LASVPLVVWTSSVDEVLPSIFESSRSALVHQPDGVPSDQGVICILSLMNTLNDDVPLSCRLGFSNTDFVMPVRGFRMLDPGNLCLMALV
jgi:hypothetical protein